MPRKAQKKRKERVKKELMESIMENGKKEEPGLQERVHDRTDIADVIRVTKKYY